MIYLQMKTGAGHPIRSVIDSRCGCFDADGRQRLGHATLQVAAHQGPEVDAAGSDLRVYPDVQHLLATTYKNLSTSARHTYIDRAEQLMSTSFFAGHPPPSHSIGEVNSLEPPLHRTLLSFTFQFVGLGKTDVRLEGEDGL